MNSVDAVVIVIISVIILFVIIYFFVLNRKAQYALQFYNNGTQLPNDFQLLIRNLPVSMLSITSTHQALNLLFCSDPYCFSPLYAWIESVTTGLANIWVKIPYSIKANSSFTIYVYHSNSIQFPYTGINEIYNYSLDNGYLVFDAYMNFMGSSQVISAPYKVYANVSTEYVPQTFSVTTQNNIHVITVSGVGYYLTLNNQKGAYSLVYLLTTKSARIPEVFEGIASYVGSGDFQGLVFFANTTSGITHICEPSKLCGNFKTFSESYNVMYEAYVSNTFISPGTGSPQSVIGESFLTNNGVNYYEAVVENNEIYFYGTAVTTWNDIYNAKLLNHLSIPVKIYGSGFGFADSSGGLSHLGGWLLVRARAYPPNGIMPQFVGITTLSI